MSLAPYAVSSSNSLGRKHEEPAPLDRDEFQRDRDRIIHSTAFRRLEYKTQVFVNHEGDMYRTRLTHSLEVAQIARSIARNLCLNEDLTEAIALAHDLGHTPFGHAGQTALNYCMQEYGGFEHNLQSIRVVDLLERKYAGFPGLNLCFETREGILKHASLKNAEKLGSLGLRFIKRRQPSLEAQLVDVADAIAYNNHDVDDGLRSGLLTVATLLKSSLFKTSYEHVKDKYQAADEKIILLETVRYMIHKQITDLITSSEQNLKNTKPATLDDVRAQDTYLIGFSKPMTGQHLELKKILNTKMYKHPVVAKMSRQADEIVKFLFNHFLENPEALPESQQVDFKNAGITTKAMICSDYIAGMTDRFARKLFFKLNKHLTLHEEKYFYE